MEEKKIIKRGNGAAIPMTKDMFDLLGIAAGDAVRVRFEGRRMIVTPAGGTASGEEYHEALTAVLDENADVLAKLAE